MIRVSADDTINIGRETRKPARSAAIDFTKGALVLAMVLYHWASYFVSVEGFYYRYLRFVTPSFILITGVLIGHVYVGRVATDPGVSKRLLQRGLKLLALFAGINIAAGVAGAIAGDASGLTRFRANAALIFTWGDDTVAAFEVLVPIAYLLLLGSLVLLAYHTFKYSAGVLCAVAFLALGALSRVGMSSFNLRLLAIGLMGIVFARMAMNTFDRISNHLWALGGAYLMYCLIITYADTPYILQVAGTWLSVAAIYAIGVRWGTGGWLPRHVILLGQYSLLGYLAQIVILRLLRVALAGTSSVAVRWTVSFIGALLLTSVTILVVNFFRTRSRTAASLYRLVFG